MNLSELLSPHVDKAEGKRIRSYMSCLLCLCNTKQATLKQNWSKCGSCFKAQINYGLAEKPGHAREEHGAWDAATESPVR